MALGIPLVISPDAALLEVSDGHAVTLPGLGPHAVAEAVVQARQLSQNALSEARRRASEFTWARSAMDMRAMLQEALGYPQSSTLRSVQSQQA
jgi:glycosyltransferase involved in cell wall biosynthesis